MKEQGCENVYILNDKEVYGKGLADQVEKIAGEQGLEVLGNDGIDTKAANFRALASKVGGANGCFFFGGITQNKGVQVFKDVAAAANGHQDVRPGRRRRVGVQREAGLQPREAGVHHEPDAGSEVLPAGGPEVLRGVQGEERQGPRALRDLRLRGHERRARGDRDRQRRTGAESRKAVVDAFFQTKGRESVLGTYDIDENGDTTLSDYGGYKIEGGKLVFDKVIKAATS